MGISCLPGSADTTQAKHNEHQLGWFWPWFADLETKPEQYEHQLQWFSPGATTPPKPSIMSISRAGSCPPDHLIRAWRSSTTLVRPGFWASDDHPTKPEHQLLARAG